jgi:myxalamid-type polyketide synthase MxaE and MxaD
VPTAHTPNLADHLLEAGPAERRAAIEQLVRETVGGVLRLPAPQLHARRQLGQMGLDSLMALELRSRFERALGRPLSATLAFNHPTVEALTAYFDALLAPEPTADAATAAGHTAVDADGAGDDATEGLLVSLAELSDLSDADVADALRGARQAS